MKTALQLSLAAIVCLAAMTQTAQAQKALVGDSQFTADTATKSVDVALAQFSDGGLGYPLPAKSAAANKVLQLDIDGGTFTVDAASKPTTAVAAAASSRPSATPAPQKLTFKRATMATAGEAVEAGYAWTFANKTYFVEDSAKPGTVISALTAQQAAALSWIN